MKKKYMINKELFARKMLELRGWLIKNTNTTAEQSLLLDSMKAYLILETTLEANRDTNLQQGLQSLKEMFGKLKPRKSPKRRKKKK